MFVSERSAVCNTRSAPRAVLNGILWVLGTGAQWRELPEKSAVPNLASPVPAMGAGREAGRHLARTGRGVARPKEIATGGGFHRRLLHWGKKGASRSDPPSAAKGRKSSLSPMITVFLSYFVSAGNGLTLQQRGLFSACHDYREGFRNTLCYLSAEERLRSAEACEHGQHLQRPATRTKCRAG